eukprot:TRINITY_DN20929_c0_g1_i1.p1 TRINITY_DN20929_c0_g1~~TRINITY_DN20929_c0_g1_i1.p1  ORF type:complete len:190 (+),score=70.17 TRINITY_DN20929_c0_g1_i1:315-884(+)
MKTYIAEYLKKAHAAEQDGAQFDSLLEGATLGLYALQCSSAPHLLMDMHRCWQRYASTDQAQEQCADLMQEYKDAMPSSTDVMRDVVAKAESCTKEYDTYVRRCPEGWQNDLESQIDREQAKPFEERSLCWHLWRRANRCGLCSYAAQVIREHKSIPAETYDAGPSRWSLDNLSKTSVDADADADEAKD